MQHKTDLKHQKIELNQHRVELNQHRVELKQHRIELKRKHAEITHLNELLRLARHKRFGSSSERFLNQPSLFNEAEDSIALGPTANKELRNRKKSQKRRKLLPPELPREAITYDITSDEKICSCCKVPMHEIGTVVTEQLDIIPARVKVKKHIRKKYACGKCKQVIKVARMPKQVIPKSWASPGLLATIATNKYADCLPLYRQESILKRAGIDLARSTLASWMIKLGELFQPLINLMRDDLLSRPLIQADETTIQVIKEKGRKAQAKSYVWVIGSGRLSQAPPILLFYYHPTRAASVPIGLLENWQGYLVTDAYDGYNKVVSKNRIIHCGCFDHVRRKFDEAIKARGTGAAPGLAEEGLWYLQKIYAVEAEARTKSAKQRNIARNLYSKQILKHLRKWLDRKINLIRPSSNTGKALNYLNSNWIKLTKFIEDPQIPISNEFCENAIRPFTVGRKNWLFSMTPNGADASCSIYSMIETAKASGLEPYSYLNYIIERLPNCETIEEYEVLLPYKLDPKVLIEGE
ncbi:MAG: IS66 family transposase [Oligoflexales bacterium]